MGAFLLFSSPGSLQKIKRGRFFSQKLSAVIAYRQASERISLRRHGMETVEMKEVEIQTRAAVEAMRRVLWAQDLRARWGVSLATLWRWRRAGLMPQPDFMDSGWRLMTIENFESAGGIPDAPSHPRHRTGPARHK